MKRNTFLFCIIAAAIVFLGDTPFTRAQAPPGPVSAGGAFTGPNLPSPVDSTLSFSSGAIGALYSTGAWCSNSPPITGMYPVAPQESAVEIYFDTYGNSAGSSTPLVQTVAGTNTCGSPTPYQYSYSATVNTAGLSNGFHQLELCLNTGGSSTNPARGVICNFAGFTVSHTCAPSCSGKTCGSNGCGGSCGTCGSGTTCNASSQCVPSNICSGTACVANSGGSNGTSCSAPGSGNGTCGGCASDAGCNDGNPCTTDSCNLGTGVCSHTNSCSGVSVSCSIGPNPALPGSLVTFTATGSGGSGSYTSCDWSGPVTNINGNGVPCSRTYIPGGAGGPWTTEAVTIHDSAGNTGSITCPSYTVQDFSVSAAPSTLSFAVGSGGSFVVTANSILGFTGTVTFGYSAPSSLPAGFTASWASGNSCTVPANGSCSKTFNVASTTYGPGSVVFTFTGTYAPILTTRQAANVTAQVTPGGCSPTTTCAAQGRNCGTLWDGCVTETCGGNGGGCPAGNSCNGSGVCVPTVTCNAYTLQSFSTTPASVAPGGGFQVACNYGNSSIDCVNSNVSAAGPCTWAGWSGTSATFNCTAASGDAPGSYANTCALYTGSASNCCSTSAPAGSVTVVNTVSGSCAINPNPALPSTIVTFNANPSGGSGTGYTCDWSGGPAVTMSDGAAFNASGQPCTRTYTPGAVDGPYTPHVVVHDSLGNVSGSIGCPSYSVQDYSVTALPSATSSLPGDMKTYTVTAAGLNGFSGDVTMSQSAGLPAGGSGTWSECAAGKPFCTCTIQGADPTPGPVGLWKFNENGGSTANDSSGNGMTGTLVNSPVWVPGQFGSALQFNGTNQNVSVPDNPLLDITGDISISFWVKVTSQPANWGGMVGKGLSPTYGVFWTVGTAPQPVLFQQGSFLLYSTTKLNLNTLYHVVSVVSGSNASIYINGVLDKTGVRSGPPSVETSQPLTVGSAQGPYYLPGMVDDVRVYNRALSAAEVATLYAGSGNGTCSLNYSVALNSTYAGPWTSYPLNFNGAFAPIPGLVRSGGATYSTWNYTIVNAANPPVIPAGSGGAGTVQIVSANGFNQAVDLSSTIDTAGCTGCSISFAGGSTQVANGGTLSLPYTFQTSGATPAGTYAFTLHGKAPGGNPPTGPDPVPGPLAYWKFDDGSGSTANDSTGNGNTGTLANSPAWVAGPTVDALQFNGSNQYVTVPSIPALQITGDMSIAFWLKVTSQPASWAAVVSKGPVGQQEAYGVWTEIGAFPKPILFEEHNGNTQVLGLDSNTLINLNTLYHVVAVQSGNNSSIYINGVLDKTGVRTGTPSADAGPLLIGASAVSGIGSFALPGMVDDVRVYNRALSAAEVATIYSGSGSAGGPYFLDRTAAGSVTVQSFGVTAFPPASSFNDFFPGETKDFTLTANSQNNFAGTVNFTTVWPGGSTTPPANITVSWPDGQSCAVPAGSICSVRYRVTAGAGYAGPWQDYSLTFNGNWSLTTKTANGVARLMNFTATLSPVPDMQIPGDSFSYTMAVTPFNLTPTGGGASGPSNPAPGPVGYWNLDENGGSTAGDSSGNGLTGSLVNSPAWVPGQYGSALQFNGTSNYVEVPDNPLLRITGDLTIAYWVKVTSQPASWSPMVGKGGTNLTGVNYGVWWTAGTAPQPIRFHQENGSTVIVDFPSSTKLNLNTLYHVAVVVSGNNVSIYINGALDATAVRSGPSSADSTPLRIGAELPDGAYFPGMIDDVRVYNRALSAAEIASLYTGTAATGGMLSTVPAFAPAPAVPFTFLPSTNQAFGAFAACSPVCNSAGSVSYTVTLPNADADVGAYTASSTVAYGARKSIALTGPFSAGDFSLNAIPNQTVPQVTSSNPIALTANTLQNWYGIARSITYAAGTVPGIVGTIFPPLPTNALLAAPSVNTPFQISTTNATLTGIYAATVTGTVGIRSHAQPFTLTVVPAITSAALSATGAICVTSTRQINLTWPTAIANPGLSYRIDRSSNNFASFQSFTINAANWANFCTPQGAPGSCSCEDLGGTSGPSCGSGNGVPALAALAPGPVWSYRIVAADPFGSTTGPTLNVPSPDCAPGFNTTGGSPKVAATITSWCGSGVATPPPGVTGSINWQYCDPDDPTWPNCAPTQTTPVSTGDPQGQFCTQISDDPTFSNALFNATSTTLAGCGVARACGPITVTTVQFDAVGSAAGAGGDGVSSLSWTHVMGGGTNGLLTVGVAVGAHNGDAGLSLAVTYNGIPMSSTPIVHSNNTNGGFVQLFYLANPPAGSHTVQVNLSGGGNNDIEGGSVSFIGVDPNTPLRNIATNAGSGTSPSVVVASTPGDMVVSALANGDSITSSGQTMRWHLNQNNQTNGGDGAQSTAPGAASVTMNYAVTSDMWGIIGADVAAATTNGGCLSGVQSGSAGSCAFGTGVTCMTGSLLYNHQYYYRTKVSDTSAWGAGSGNRVFPAGQIAYWKLDEAPGSTLFADSSGNGYNATCGWSPSPISYVQDAAGNGAYPPSSNAVSVTFPAANTAGNMIVLSLDWGGQAINVASISDTRGNAYSSAVGPTNWSTSNRQQIFYAKNIGGGANTVTIAMSGTPSYLLEARAYEYSGLDPASPLDNTSAAIGTGTALASGAASTNVPNDLVFGLGQADNSTLALTAGAGFNGHAIAGGSCVVPTPALVQSTSANGNGAPPSSLAMAFPSAITAGNFVIVSVNWQNSAVSVASVTDSNGNVYTAFGPQQNFGTANANRLFYAKNAAGGADTVTVSMSGSPTSFFQMSAYEYAGIDRVSPLDTYAWAVGADAASNQPVAGAAGYTGHPVANAGHVLAEDKTVNAAGWYDAMETAGATTLTTGQAISNASDLIFGLGQESGNATGWDMEMAALRTAGSGGLATPAYVQSAASIDNPGSISTVVVTFPSAQAAGNLNVVTVGWHDTSASIASVVDSNGNVYTRAIGPIAGTGVSQSVYYAKSIAGGAGNMVTVTFSSAANNPSVIAAEYSGVDPTNPLWNFASSTGQGWGGSVVPGFAIPVNTLIVVPITVSNGSILNVNGSPVMRALTSPSNLQGLADMVNPVTQQDNIGFNSSNGVTNYSMAEVMFKPAPLPDSACSTVTTLGEDKAVSSFGSYSAAETLNSSASWVMQMAAFSAAYVNTCPTLGVPGAPVLTGTAASFNADTVQTRLGNSVQGLAQASLSVWFKTSVLDGTEHVLYDEPTALAATSSRFRLSVGANNKLLFEGRAQDGSALTPWVVSTVALATNAWNHVVAIFDSQSDIMTLYVNGVAQTNALGTVGFSNTAPAAPARIGTAADGASNPWNGTIDDVQLFPRALTAVEVSELYTGGINPSAGALWSTWSCSSGGTCAPYSFIQDHFFTFPSPFYTVQPAAIRQGIAQFYSGTASTVDSLVNASAGAHAYIPAVNTIPNVPSPWFFSFGDGGTGSSTSQSPLPGIATPGSSAPPSSRQYTSAPFSSYTYSSAGTFTLAMTVTDNQGNSCTTSTLDTVKPRLPSWVEVRPGQ